MRRAVLAALLAATAPAAAQRAGDPPVVTSPAPAEVAVTVYRDPNRTRGGAIDLGYLGGFALITETRRVVLPRGRSVLRFEAVADGIVPVSAIVDGLPGGTVEKNRDARLLSPASLVDGTLGREVTLSRLDRASGRRSEERATIVAGPVPGVVLRTARGIETLRCSGLAETLGFAGVPAGLSAAPVLSVTTDSPSARTVTVTLSYLASGFDWSASYVATVAPGASSLDLHAWLTLANANPEAFPAARVQAVAGRLNRTGFERMMRQAEELQLSCYPLGTTTSDLREERPAQDGDIIVTAQRRYTATAIAAPPPPPAPMVAAPPPPPEDLGDLKLYRVPDRVTVAPRAQKQVALLARAAVPFERRYRLPVGAGQALLAAPTRIVLVVRNSAAGGLGLALPTGSTALYADRPGGRLLLGTGTLADRAEGEVVRIASGISRQVLVEQQAAATGTVLTVTNANPFAVTAELLIGAAGQKIAAEGASLPRIDGVATWTVTLPPNGRAELSYRF